MGFFLKGKVVRDEALRLELRIHSAPEFNLYLALTTDPGPDSRYRVKIWESDFKEEVRECVREVVVGEGYATRPDQRLVDFTGRTEFGAVAHLLLDALRAAVALPEFQNTSGGARSVRLVAAGRLVSHLRPALDGGDVGDRVTLAERPIESTSFSY